MGITIQLESKCDISIFSNYIILSLSQYVVFIISLNTIQQNFVIQPNFPDFEFTQSYKLVTGI